MSIDLANRKPARRMSEIPTDVKRALNKGVIESKNLVEWLSVDREALAKSVLHSHGIAWEPRLFKQRAKQLKKRSALIDSRLMAELLAPALQLGGEPFRQLSQHTSDVVREWMAFAVGFKHELTFRRALAWIKTFADDNNPGVREVAWFSLRPRVIEDVPLAIKELTPWTGSRSERLRRYASEITRPCGVWAAHIPFLKEAPACGLAILEPLRADTAKYVRDSVANWLNDASKTQPAWVSDITSRWLIESPCPETQAIVNRAIRTIRKS